MNTTSILIKTDPLLKKKAQQTAEEMGISLTSVINLYLRHFIKTKSITFTAGNDIPTQYLLDSLSESEEDIKAGRVISFDSATDEFAYLDKMIKDEKQNLPSH